ncbi:chitin synthase-domain-containing protein [Mycena alexandri]|uniref:Chitin synthase-domain-containing protein n=1 Tax=Mycena alexandri TaxID=1745969 RepID=A0AAD6WZN6_9AGAR|nr:chitin synthase-domain-containing protein [Mycena alexandri]
MVLLKSFSIPTTFFCFNIPRPQHRNYTILIQAENLGLKRSFKSVRSLNAPHPISPESTRNRVLRASLRFHIYSTNVSDEKLLLIICDGNGCRIRQQPPHPRVSCSTSSARTGIWTLSRSAFESRRGAKQHNTGMVGKPAERSRPGDRGKRDSQMLLMHFLYKVHFNSPINPLELGMYHQIKNVIGVNPTFYKYIFMVDADTTVDHFSVNRLISSCSGSGETQLANAKQLITTMMQFYEYFISHNMAKAFKSLFSSVTCLPGCFTLYRLRTTHKPLLISNQLIQDYSENCVDTLHMKNLLHLGEDRLSSAPPAMLAFGHRLHGPIPAPSTPLMLLRVTFCTPCRLQSPPTMGTSKRGVGGEGNAQTGGEMRELRAGPTSSPSPLIVPCPCLTSPIIITALVTYTAGAVCADSHLAGTLLRFRTQISYPSALSPRAHAAAMPRGPSFARTVLSDFAWLRARALLLLPISPFSSLLRLPYPYKPLYLCGIYFAKALWDSACQRFGKLKGLTRNDTHGKVFQAVNQNQSAWIKRSKENETAVPSTQTRQFDFANGIQYLQKGNHLESALTEKNQGK